MMIIVETTKGFLSKFRTSLAFIIRIYHGCDGWIFFNPQPQIWILTKLAQWFWEKNWLNFGDLGPIF